MARFASTYACCAPSCRALNAASLSPSICCKAMSSACRICNCNCRVFCPCTAAALIRFSHSSRRASFCFCRLAFIHWFERSSSCLLYFSRMRTFCCSVSSMLASSASCCFRNCSTFSVYSASVPCLTAASRRAIFCCSCRIFLSRPARLIFSTFKTCCCSASSICC